jgi:putative heme transporter
MSGEPAPAAARRLRRLGETCLWLLVVGAALVAALWVAAKLRLVVLPVLLAVVLATFLWPLACRLRERGVPDGLAALLSVLATLTGVGGLGYVVWTGLDDLDDLGGALTAGIEEVQTWLREGPLGLSDGQVAAAFDRFQDQVQENVGRITSGAVTGAIILVEVIAGLLIAVVVLFFLLKDGDDVWAWLRGLAPPEHRHHVDALGRRSFDALGGFLRGQTIVALFDAVFIGLALWVIGVPLVIPLAVITFLGAYVPIVGATVAGLAAVLVALVSNGLVPALLVLAAIVAVQQIESNVLEPVVVGRSIHVHPLAVLLGVTAGAVLAGIIGAMVAAPVVAVGGAVLGYLRELADGAPQPRGSPG